MLRHSNWLGVGAIALLACACAKPNPLIGTWVSNDQVAGRVTRHEDTYDADGKYHSTVTVQGGQFSRLIVKDTGTWKLIGTDKLQVTLTDTDWEFEGVTEAGRRKGRERLAKEKAKVLKEANAEPPATIKWKGDDEFKVQLKNITQTYKRKA